MAVLPKVNSKLLFFQKKAFNFSFGGGRRGLFEDWVGEEREEVRPEETQVTLSPALCDFSFFSFLFFFFFSPPSLFLAGSFVQAFYSLTAALNISHIRSSAKLCASGHIALKPLVCQLQSASQMVTCLLWMNIKRRGSLDSPWYLWN